MNILDRIVERKKEEIKIAADITPLSALMDSENMHRQVFSLSESLSIPGSTGIIAEFKRKSPSRGYINKNADAYSITSAYQKNGASALSVLTDQDFFGAETGDFSEARKNSIPILRKDFIIDHYQVYEAKAMGADAILLIAACLSIDHLRELACSARETGMEVILEIHHEDELKHICREAQLIGINNRDLKSFSVDINRSVELRKMLPGGFLPVAESGISNPATVNLLKEQGFKGFLIGETFMKTGDPGRELKQFIEQLKSTV